MVINIKRSSKISENWSAVIPSIMSQNVQTSYSAFGRETKGKNTEFFIYANLQIIIR